MKICHIAIVTPGKAGLYETTRELVAAERRMHVDARIYDPKPTAFYPVGQKEDRGALLADRSFVDEADLIVDHSGCDGTTDGLKTPHILVAHGRPRYSFLSEVNGRAPVYSYHYRLEREEKYRAVVTFWPEHVAYLRATFQKTPVLAIPPSVDLTAWSHSGPMGYSFGGKAGAFNLVCTDAWREDVDLFDTLHAAILAAREVNGIRVHIYGKQTSSDRGWSSLWRVMRDAGILGEVHGWVKGLDNVYRVADMLITPQRIYTRSIREAMACGCPVVRCLAGQPDHGSTCIVNMLRRIPDRAGIRREAEALFDPMGTARAFLALAVTVLGD